MNKITGIDCYDSMIAVSWSDGEVGYIPLSFLRKSCPCAFCGGEKDVFGNIYKGEDKPLSKEANTIASFAFIGRYGVKFVWGDGHSDGIYTFSFLKHLVAVNEKK